MKKILFVFGTRPEAIKFAPLVKAFKAESSFDAKVCITSQHKEMLQQVMEFFAIEADYDLDVMKPNQDLSTLTSTVLTSLSKVLGADKPDLLFVQGDTTTAFIGALAAFYYQVPVAHLEAGLRSFNKYSPFPEEINRKLISPIADLHFAPTEAAATHLKAEGITDNVHVVGNTVIDALILGLNLIKERGEESYLQQFQFLDFNRKIILVTGHRRESFGEGFEGICLALNTIAGKYPEVQIVYPVHLNPNVQEPVNRLLKNSNNIFLLPPVSYAPLIWLMNKCHMVITDSGGIQEEAPTLGKPVLVMRDVTERMEGVHAGTAKLVGTKSSSIIDAVVALMEDEQHYNQMARANNPYGDGLTSSRVVDIVQSYLN